MKTLLLILPLTLMAAGSWAQPPGGLVDPLRPDQYQSPPPADGHQAREDLERWRDQLRLTAILTASDRAVAIINGRALQVGQTLGDFTLTTIAADRVVLRKGGQELTLYQAVASVRKTPAIDGPKP